MGFITLIGCLLIFVPAVLGLEALKFVADNIWTVSIIFWGILGFAAIIGSRSESKPEEKCAILTAPLAVLPAYIFLVCSMDAILATTGFELLLVVLFEVPLTGSFNLFVGLIIWQLGSKIKDPLFSATFTVVCILVFTCIITNLGI